MNFFETINKGARGGRVMFVTPEKTSVFFDVNDDPQAWAESRTKSNVYFSCSLMRKPKSGRGGISDTVGITMLWLDLDIADEAHKSDKCPNRQQAMEVLAAYPVRPSIIIHSGHGLHCYWLLETPWMFSNDADRNDACEFMRGWQGIAKQAAAAMGLTVDSTHDLARVLRVPGTYNLKNDQRLLVTVERMDDVRYDVDALRPSLVNNQEPAKVEYRPIIKEKLPKRPDVFVDEADDFDSFIQEIWEAVAA